MNSVRASAPQLADITPYDPKYLPARAYLSANENPCDVETEVRNEIKREINKVAFNRYPDPLANELRDMIAEANGLDRDCVLVGNGGDELLFDIALAWGGPGRKFLNMPPTFSVYRNNAELTNTEVVDIPAPRRLHHRRGGGAVPRGARRHRLRHRHQPEQPYGRFGR